MKPKGCNNKKWSQIEAYKNEVFKMREEGIKYQAINDHLRNTYNVWITTNGIRAAVYRIKKREAV